MNKDAYLAGAYPVGSAKYKMAKRMFGPIPAAAPVEKVSKPVKEVVKPVAKKKTVKKAAKKKSDD